MKIGELKNPLVSNQFYLKLRIFFKNREKKPEMEENCLSLKHKMLILVLYVLE